MTIANQLQTAFKVYDEYVTPDSTDIKYELFYDKGGMSYFNGQYARRGWYLSVRPVTRVDNGNWTSESFAVFGNKSTKYFLNSKELTRNSPKALSEARSNVTDALITELTNHVKGE